MEYEGKKFVNVSTNEFDLSSKEEKVEVEKINNDNKELLDTYE